MVSVLRLVSILLFNRLGAFRVTGEELGLDSELLTLRVSKNIILIHLLLKQHCLLIIFLILRFFSCKTTEVLTLLLVLKVLNGVALAHLAFVRDNPHLLLPILEYLSVRHD
jgi:hypothetical protein